MKSRRLDLGIQLACALALAGCSSDGGGDWRFIVEAARRAWVERDAPVSLQQAADVPYASVGLRIDGGHEQLLILAMDSSGEQLWTSPAHVALQTRNGRIIRTAGLGTDLAARVAKGEPDTAALQIGRYTWTGDYPDLGLYGALVTCTVEPPVRESITILGQSLDTNRQDETCEAADLKWTFKNSYWISANSGTVWRSIQHTHPKGPTLEWEILRPPLSYTR